MHYRHVAWSLAAFLLGASASAATAQGLRPVQERPTIGLLAGINLADVSDSDFDGADKRTGLIGGVFVTFHITPVLGIQPELLYSQKGVSFNSSDVDATLKLDYIDVPVLLRFNIPTDGAQVRPFFVAGPAFGIQVNCGIKASSDGMSGSVDCDRIDDESGIDFNTKTFDFSGVLGAGLDFNIGQQTLMLGARYEHGFSEVFDGATAKNRTWSIVAGFGF